MGTQISKVKTMARTISILILSILVVATTALPYEMMNATNFTLGSRGASGCTTDDKTFDYLLLVHQWPAAQQSSTWPKGAVIDDFTLHGLWPSRIGADVASYPCTCTNEQFDSSKVSSIA